MEPFGQKDYSMSSRSIFILRVKGSHRDRCGSSGHLFLVTSCRLTALKPFFLSSVLSQAKWGHPLKRTKNKDPLRTSFSLWRLQCVLRYTLIDLTASENCNHNKDITKPILNSFIIFLKVSLLISLSCKDTNKNDNLIWCTLDLSFIIL